MNPSQSDKQGALNEWLSANAPDCGDNSCLFGGRGKGGMRTNGGCRCFKDLPTTKRIYVERLYAALSSGAPSERQRIQEIWETYAAQGSGMSGDEFACLVATVFQFDLPSSAPSKDAKDAARYRQPERSA